MSLNPATDDLLRDSKVNSRNQVRILKSYSNPEIESIPHNCLKIQAQLTVRPNSYCLTPLCVCVQRGGGVNLSAVM